MNWLRLLKEIGKTSKIICACLLAFLLMLSFFQPTLPTNQFVGSSMQPTSVRAQGDGNNEYVEELERQRSANRNILFNIFPACGEAQTSTIALLSCIQQIVTFSFFIGIVVFFIRVTYIAIVSIANPGKGSTFKSLREATYGLIVGIIFVGIPVTIMSLINPLSGQITFNFLEEFNLGPEANLIDVTPDEKGCVAFNSCVITCRNTKGGSERVECVSDCKNRFSECDECHEYINENGTVTSQSDYSQCIAPTSSGSSSAGSGNSASSTGVVANIDPDNWLATAPSYQCLTNRYGSNLSEVNQHIIDYDFSFFNGGNKDSNGNAIPVTSGVNKEAAAGFDCVKNRLSPHLVQGQQNQYQFDFPGGSGPPEFGGPYAFTFSNTVGRPLDGFSFHPFGLAIDLNVGCNCGEYGSLCSCGQGVTRDMPQYVVDTFNSCGFFWGGEWYLATHGARNDPMHFEYHAIPCPGMTRAGIEEDTG